jgi:hypothetical protein
MAGIVPDIVMDVGVGAGVDGVAGVDELQAVHTTRTTDAQRRFVIIGPSYSTEAIQRVPRGMIEPRDEGHEKLYWRDFVSFVFFVTS